MSNIRLRHTRPIVAVDTETTGTDAAADRIIEIAILVLNPDGTRESKVTRINPERPIPAGATAVHGIRDEDVAGAPTFRQLAKAIAARLAPAQCEAAAGYNVGFDLKIIAAELARCGISFDPESLPTIDGMRIFHAREPRTLTGAVRHYLGRDHAGAHGALADIEASVDVLLAQVERYGLSTDAAALADEGRDPDALDAEGRIVWRDGAARLSFGKHAGTTLADADPSYLRWMLGQDFGSTTKNLLRDALAGRFPSGPRAVRESAAQPVRHPESEDE